MKRHARFPSVVVLVILSLFSTPGAQGANFTAEKTGLWSDPATWGAINAPVTVGAGDVVTVPIGLTVTIPASLTVVSSGQIVCNAGTIAVKGGITNNGRASLSDLADGHISVFPGGVINNTQYASISIAAAGFLLNRGTINNSSSISNNGGSVTNRGAIANLDKSITLIQQSGVLSNYGTISNAGPMNLTTGTIRNYGAFTNVSGGITMNANSIITNYGQMTNSAASLISDVYGTITNKPGSTFVNAVDSVVTNGYLGSFIINSGASLLNDGGYITNYHVLTNNPGGAVTLASGQITNSGTITNGGSMLIMTGLLDNTGTLENSTGATLTINTGMVNNTKLISNYGALTNSGTIANNAALYSELVNYGAMTNSGNILDFSVLTNSAGASLANTGALTVYCGGVFTSMGSFTGNAATYLPCP